MTAEEAHQLELENRQREEFELSWQRHCKLAREFAAECRQEYDLKFKRNRKGTDT